MRTLMWLSVVFAFGCLGEVVSRAEPQNDLQCFQCKSNSTDECRKLKYLKACPNDQAYDRCQTILARNGEYGNITVTKSCVLAPCFLGKKANDGLGMSDDCDDTKPSYQCVSCCKKSGCNAAPPTTAHVAAQALTSVSIAWLAALRTLMNQAA